ncbi:MAG: TIGR02281 family clan AA aspartic protease [Hyphomicrobiales bacterium]|nr:TIGR02281 family clan AA aspartic protease [Hyphomicrobiales bacterium]
MTAWLALGLLVVAGLALVLSHDSGTIAGFDNADFAGLAALLALLVFLGGSMFGSYRGRLAKGLRDAVVWGAFAFVLIALYSFRNDLLYVFERVAGELVPGLPVTTATDSTGASEVRIRRQVGGQFVARTDINGQSTPMIVDTGATTVVLTQTDARRIGIDPSSLNYGVPVQTANGTSFAARVRLNRVSVGSVAVNNVEALIARPGALHQSLLGMSFLSRLRSYEFSGDVLTLRS